MPQLSFFATEGVHRLYCDFADYQGLTPTEMFAIHATEHVEVLGTGDMETISSLHAANRRLLRAHLEGKSKHRLIGSVDDGVVEQYRFASRSSGLKVAYLARVAVMHGLILEMDMERFSFSEPVDATEELESP